MRRLLLGLVAAALLFVAAAPRQATAAREQQQQPSDAGLLPTAPPQRPPPSPPAEAAAAGTAGANVSSGSADALQQQCPDWFRAYEAFHASTRGQPDARYLVHQVPPHSVGKSGGFGDRLRGMLFALRLAAATQRVLLYTWARPVELHELLVPAAAINWTTAGVPGLQPGGNDALLQHALVLRFMNGAHHPRVVDGKLATANDSVIVVQTNTHMDAACPGCPPLRDMDVATACVWQRLFRPVPDIEADADAELLRLYNSTSPRFVAIHLRLGGLTGEAEHERASGPLKNFAGAIACANQLARGANVSAATPLLLVTDNAHLRGFVRGHNLANVVAPSTTPVHTDQALALDHNLGAHRTTVIDLLLLARGACLVTSPGYRHGSMSGFSHHGWLLGGAKPCHIDFRRCI